MIDFVYGTMLAALPVAIAGIGGVLTQKAGVLNIALEGLILCGAFAAAVVAVLTGSLTLALLAGILCGGLAVQLPSVLSLRFGANIFIAGLGLNLLAVGLIPTLSELLVGTSGVFRFPAAVSRANWAAVVGSSLLTAVAMAAVLLLRNTRAGFELTAAGSQPELLRRRGDSPARYQALALTLSGLTAGAAGALLSIRIGAYAPGMSAGRGWIALGTVFLGFQHPVGVIIGAAVYGVADAAAGSLQGLSVLPNSVLMTLPYVITVIAFIVSSGIRSRKTRG